MKNFICIVLGIAMTFSSFTSSVYAGFQTQIGCAFYLEHESNKNTGPSVTTPANNATTPVVPNQPAINSTPSPTITNQPTTSVPPPVTINPIPECPDPGSSGGSIAASLFGGIFLGFLLGVGATIGVAYAILKQNFPEVFELDTLNESQFGEYGTFELEPTYYAESDSPGIRFKFSF